MDTFLLLSSGRATLNKIVNNTNVAKECLLPSIMMARLKSFCLPTLLEAANDEKTGTHLL